MTYGSGQLARRRFLRGIGAAAGLGAVALGGGLLSSCSAQDLAAVPLAAGASDRSRRQKVVRFANWPGYLDQAPTDPGQHPTLAEFTRRTGIAVEYSEPIDGNEEFFAQIGMPLALGESTGYDLVVLSDWLIPELIQLGWLDALSPGGVPNASRLRPEFRNWPVADVRRFSLPWQGGLTGIAYNMAATHRPVTSMHDLLTAPDLKGRVSLVADMRDVMGLIILAEGGNPAAFSSTEFGSALAMLRRSIQTGQIRAVTNDYTAGLSQGTIAACVAWSGDVLGIQPSNADVRFTWPSAGGMLWTDNMVIPAFAGHKENAERLMSYYYEPAVAARLSAQELFLCPVIGADVAMRQVDPALAEDRYIFPTPKILQSSYHFMILSPQQSMDYTASYNETVGL